MDILNSEAIHALNNSVEQSPSREASGPHLVKEFPYFMKN
jgi:hypothetical protein